MQIPLDRTAGPMYLQIARFIRQQIQAGNLPEGAHLPSIRGLAERLGVSKSVVTLAYAELEAGGHAKGRIGQGTVVTGVAEVSLQQAAPIAVPQHAANAAVLHDLMRLADEGNLINFTTMSPASDHLPMDAFGRCLKAVLSQDGPAAWGYHTAEGYEPLRHAIARQMAERGIITAADEVLVTAGAQQAIDIAIRSLSQAGDWIIVESPCWISVMEVAERHGLRVATAPMDGEGLVVESLEPMMRELRPRLLYTNPTFHNPTCTVMPLERRRRLLELAERYGVTIIEDAVSSDLELNGTAPPALRALSERVIHCGSFSKALLPGIRMGYVIAPESTTRELLLVKQLTDIHSPGILQRALARFLDAGLFTGHLRRIKQIYIQRRNAALATLRKQMPDGVRWSVPAGGLLIWVELPAEVDVTQLYLRAIDAGVGFTPGTLFYPEGRPQNHLRLSYGAEQPDRIRTGIALLGGLIRQALRQVQAESRGADVV